MSPFYCLDCSHGISEDDFNNLKKPAPIITRIAGFWEMAFIV